MNRILERLILLLNNSFINLQISFYFANSFKTLQSKKLACFQIAKIKERYDFFSKIFNLQMEFANKYINIYFCNVILYLPN